MHDRKLIVCLCEQDLCCALQDIIGFLLSVISMLLISALNPLQLVRCR